MNQIWDELEQVVDPELGLDLVSLGLVYDVAVEEGVATITYSLTTPACPAASQLEEEMRARVGLLKEIDEVRMNLTFDPAWSPEMMSEDARFALGLYI